MTGGHAQERAGEALATPGDIESVLPFEAVLAAAGVGDEEELVEAIDSDAAAMMELDEPISLQRYASAVDFDRYPRAADAATAAYARSLQRFEGLEPSAAKAMAREEAKATANLRRRGDALTPARARRRPRLRAGKQLGVWTPVQLVLMFVFGAGMAVATLYWMGIVSTTRELHIREKFNRIESERLQREAEEQAILIEKKWDEAEAVMLELVEMTEAQMEDGHLRDAAELLISLEEIYHQVARHKPGVMDAFSETRLDDVVMPSLRRIYNVERLGGAEILEDVRSRLAELEKQRAEQVRANQAQEGD